jgi:3-hydroxyisobutyrate dehydrogenase-like beta-hydroxyacid dehydrogenase
MEVGLIGLGRSAAAIAHNLAAAGHQVTAFSPAPEQAECLAAAGAAVAPRVGDACNADAVVTMLSGDAVEAIVLGPGGVAAAMPAAAIHISMSTIGMALSRRLTAAHEQRVQRYVAAPVFGRADAAANGELLIFAAGRADTITRCQPLFDVIGRQTIVVGAEPAEANLLQLSALALISALVGSLGEAMVLADKGGIAKDRYLRLMSESLFPAGLHAGYGALIEGRREGIAGTTVEQARRVAALLTDAADAVGARTPLMRLFLNELNGLTGQGLGGAEWLEVAHRWA